MFADERYENIVKNPWGDGKKFFFLYVMTNLRGRSQVNEVKITSHKKNIIPTVAMP